MKRIFSFLILVLISVMPLIVLAHAGHGHENPLSPGHYITNPEHFIPLALAVGVVVSILVVRFFVGTKQKK